VLDHLERGDAVEGVGVEGQRVRRHLVDADPVLQRALGDPLGERVQPLRLQVDRVDPHVPLGQLDGVGSVAAADVEQPVPAGGQVPRDGPDPPGHPVRAGRAGGATGPQTTVHGTPSLRVDDILRPGHYSK
jgi:hypothetical protein